VIKDIALLNHFTQIENKKETLWKKKQGYN